MKLKGVKIRNIEKSVCCGEQVIAYNWAFHYREVLERIEKQNVIAMVKNDLFFELRDKIISQIKADEKYSKYNIDIIFIALSSGLKEYVKNYSILSKYEEIGNIFKVPYEVI